jgi:small subunit ribosomal protein S6
MANYENVIIYRSDLSPNQVEDSVKKYKDLIKEKGKVVKEENCGLKSLAYPIKKNKKGYYVVLYMEAEPAFISEYETKLRLDEDVIRYLTVKVDEIKKEESPLYKYSKSK